MSEKIVGGKQDGKFFSALTGAFIGVIVTLIFLALFAAVIYLFNLDRAYSVPLATLSFATGSFSAAYYVSKKANKKGYIIGTLVGLIAFAAVTIISLIVGKNGLTVNTIFHFIIIVLASAIGGIMGVNKNRTKKYI